MVISSPESEAVMDAKQNTGAKIAFHALGPVKTGTLSGTKLGLTPPA
jgi:hypothetical protein